MLISIEVNEMIVLQWQIIIEIGWWYCIVREGLSYRYIVDVGLFSGKQGNLQG